MPPCIAAVATVEMLAKAGLLSFVAGFVASLPLGLAQGSSQW